VAARHDHQHISVVQERYMAIAQEKIPLASEASSGVKNAAATRIRRIWYNGQLVVESQAEGPVTPDDPDQQVKESVYEAQ
jgi:hypothetical protein